MRIAVLERLIDRFFGEHTEALPPADAAEAAELAALLAGAGRPSAAPDGDPDEIMAAWLDGALDGAGRDAFEAALARAPGERQDFEAAQFFLDTVTAHPLAAPADLVEAAVAGLPDAARAAQTEGALRAVARWIGSRKWTLGTAGGAVAVAFSVVLLVSANLDSVTTQPLLPHVQPVPGPVPNKESGSIAAKPSTTSSRATSNTPPSVPAGSPVAAPAIPAVQPVAPPIVPQVVPVPAAPDAAEAAKSMERYRALEMDMPGAQQGASADRAAADPCADAADHDAGTADAQSKRPETSVAAQRDRNCDSGFSDRGFAARPEIGTAPADAAAMPMAPPMAPPATDATPH